MKKQKNKKIVVDAPLIFIIVFLICLLFIFVSLAAVALFDVVKVDGKNLKEFAANRNTYEMTLVAKRGTIYDSEGNSLALNVSSYTVLAYLSPRRTGSSKTPKHVVDVQKTAEALSPLINMSVEKLTELLSRESYQVELGPGGRGITELVKKEIESLNLPGIEFIESYKRYYPNGDFASYILGYAKTVESKNDEGETINKIVGELGLESKYNELLTGIDGKLSYQRDRYGYKIPDTVEDRIDAVDGADIYLTINSNVQRFAESAIRDLEKTYSPKWGVLAVMNAKTGEILAVSSIPSFDPNVRNITNYQSPLVTYTYEPGSTMKIFSYMCAIDSGRYNGGTIVNSGSLKIGDDEVRDWNRTGWGQITLDKGFAYSSNVAASTLVQSVITKTEYRECLEKYGFGEKTGVELAKESTGTINFTYPIEVATASFGQGITTSVMQHLQGLTIIANDGKMVKPRIVDKIVDSKGNTLYESKLTQTEKLVQTSTVGKMKELMNEVVNSSDGNTSGWRYRIPGLTLIGKTGTAQIASSSGGYLTGTNDYIYSFSGMFPAENPEIIIYAAVQKPTSSGLLATSSMVREVVINTARYFNIAGPEATDSSVEKYTLDNYVNKDTAIVSSNLKNNNIDVVVVGDGSKIIKQYPSSGTSILSNDRVFLITNDNVPTLPSLIGWSKKEAIQVLEMLNVDYEISGVGYVVSQDILEGTVINEETKVKLVLKDKYNLEEVN